MSKRVYELARELGITSNEVIQELSLCGIEVKNHLSMLEDDTIELLYSKYSFNGKNTVHFNNSSLKQIEIKGLFNLYDYRIDLKDDINIFIAENGFGKTTILNIIVE